MAEGISISIGSQGLDQVNLTLARLIAHGVSLSEPLEEIGAAFLKATQDRFESKVSPDGWPWQKLKYREGEALRLSGRLYSSYVYRVQRDQVEIGTNLTYAAIHHFGGSIQHHARSQMATFRMAKDGAFTKKDGTKVGSRLRFAKRSTKAKSAFRKAIIIGDYEVNIPARPALGVNATDRARALTIVTRYLEEALR